MLASEYYKLKDTYRNCLIGGFFFLFILLVFFAVGNYMLAMQVRAERYVETEAVIVDYVVRNTNTTALGHTTSTREYFHIVEYEFGGESYRAGCDTPTGEKNVLSQIGSTIKVFVNPKNPEDVIFRNSTHVILITASYVVCVTGFVIIAFVFYKAYNVKQTLKKYNPDNA